jgi:hypothetical protein
MLKFPLSDVVAVLSLPVALFLAVTVALGTTAPVGSVTVPRIDPVVVTCPKTGRPQIARITKTNKNLGRYLFIAGLPPKWFLRMHSAEKTG